jgi:hypothetical protein
MKAHGESFSVTLSDYVYFSRDKDGFSASLCLPLDGHNLSGRMIFFGKQKPSEFLHLFHSESKL